MSTVNHIAPSLDEANKMLVNEFGWNPECMMIGALFGEWDRFKSDWEQHGKDFAFQNFIKNRDFMARAEEQAFKAKTSAFTSRGASAYADNWN